MKFTIFTPTHNPKYLQRLDETICWQNYDDFEWLIVPNGPIKPDDINVKCPQARILPYTGETSNIGEIKKFCCDNAFGEILVEVDHDDELTHDCLSTLAKEFDHDVDFVYSNCAELDKDGNPFTFNAKFGWQYRPFVWRGKQVLECLAFEPSPASFSRIWYAPNHVRAWRKLFYHQIGGHNPARDVLDDQEIMCKTYIHGRVKHVNKVLYVYHNHPDNTCKGEKNAFIQTETMNIYDKYIYPLVERWCDLNGLRKIDLCGAISKPMGYESADLHNADFNCNLDETWPFEDGSVGLFRAHDAIEHLRNPIHTMKEAYRCLAPQGWFLTQTPSTDGRGAFQDPTHVSFFNSNSFWYYTKAETARYIGTPVKFQMPRVKNFYPSDWHKLHNIIYVKADLHKFEGRTPGLIEI
jgi:SAM-dependent methyltransferase